MTQAARSCKQNIAEGSAASGTSKETEIKLTNVARATLDELLEDYLDYLKSHGSAEWGAASEKKTAARDFSKAHSDWNDWKPLFESRPAETLCNLMIVVIQQTKYLLDRMIAAQEEDFKRHGGVRERMHAARTAARGEDWGKAIYSRLDGAATAMELVSRADEMRERIAKALATPEARQAFFAALPDDPKGGFKARIAAVAILRSHGVVDGASLSVPNRLSDADAIVLAQHLASLQDDAAAEALVGDPLFRAMTSSRPASLSSP